jgi:penicillin-binding protein 2
VLRHLIHRGTPTGFPGSLQPDPPRRLRLSLLSFAVFGLFLALFARLWYLQVLAGDRYGDLAEGNRIRQVVVDAPRGRILDRRGRVLVGNRAAWAVTVKLDQMRSARQRNQVLNRLAGVLHAPRRQLDERLRDYTGSPLRGVPVAEDVPATTIFYLAEHAREFPGVAPEVLALRDYPHGTLAAHLLGYVAEISQQELADPRFAGHRAGDLVGKAGVELTYDRWLRGTDGSEDLEVNAAGQVVRTLAVRDPIPGMDLQLSIDLDLQQTVERSLAAGMAAARTLPDSQRGGTYPAPAGAAVVLDPGSGSVLALASLPQYDPRKFVGGISKRDYAAYATDPAKPLLDRAVQSVYPPGSTWKPMTAMTGLRTGVINPSTTFDCPGTFSFGTTVKHDWTPSGHGVVDLTNSLRESCDVYYYNLGAIYARAERGQELDHKPPSEAMQQTARAFGFGRAPQLDLPFAAAGTVPDRAWRKRFWQQHKRAFCAAKDPVDQDLCREGWRWQGGDDLNIAIGQGDLQVSPLQLASAYGALANGGTVYSPHVARTVVNPATRRPLLTVLPKVASAVPIPASAFGAVDQALATVPQSGTAASAFAGFPLDRVPVAGKTGTADLPPQAPFAWFASFAPVGDPKYAVVVMVEQGGHGGESAAPVARAIYEQLFGLPVTAIGTGADRSG